MGGRAFIYTVQFSFARSYVYILYKTNASVYCLLVSEKVKGQRYKARELNVSNNWSISLVKTAKKTLKTKQIKLSQSTTDASQQGSWVAARLHVQIMPSRRILLLPAAASWTGWRLFSGSRPPCHPASPRIASPSPATPRRSCGTAAAWTRPNCKQCNVHRQEGCVFASLTPVYCMPEYTWGKTLLYLDVEPSFRAGFDEHDVEFLRPALAFFRGNLPAEN
jgi:hypothetical protein